MRTLGKGLKDPPHKGLGSGEVEAGRGGDQDQLLMEAVGSETHIWKRQGWVWGLTPICLVCETTADTPILLQISTV